MKEVWVEFFLGLVPPAALVFAALGSILFGFATPTEAAGCGAMGSLLLALAYRKLTFKKLQDSLVKTLEIAALIMVLVAASNFFGAVFSRLGTPMLLTEFLTWSRDEQILNSCNDYGYNFSFRLASRMGTNRNDNSSNHIAFSRSAWF